MEKSKKRDRSVNFSYHETELLMVLVEAKKHIVENKKSDAATWHLKESAWKAIEADFNSHPVAASVYREAKHLKSKYEAMKRDTRKKLLAHRDGETVPPLTPLEERIRELTLFSDKGEETATDFERSYEEIEVTIKPDPDLLESDNEATNEQAESPDKVTDPLDGPHSHATNEDSIENNITAVSVQPNSWVIPPNSVNNDGKRNSIKMTKWEEWRLSQLKSRKHPALTRPLKRPYEKSPREKQEEETIQRKILEENLENKKLQNTMLRQDLEHKNEIHELEKQQMQIKLEILKMELHSLRNKKQ